MDWEILETISAIIAGMLIILLIVAAVAGFYLLVMWLAGNFYALVWNWSFGSVGLATIHWWQAIAFVTVITWLASLFTRKENGASSDEKPNSSDLTTRK